MVSVQGQSLPAKKAWTDEEFRALPDDGHRYEVVNGKLVVMGAAGARHGYYVSLMHIILGSYVRSQKLGFTFDPDTSFKMASGNRRSPDCSFFSKERIKALGGIPKGYIEGHLTWLWKCYRQTTRLKKCTAKLSSILKMVLGWFGSFTPMKSMFWCITSRNRINSNGLAIAYRAKM
ncbi:MAG: Uma2 family endonuclease [Gloeomargarita sp. SKYB31]|nr:Uma2 family endonuclease [Gloeomargarita sp. SKYB31]